MSVCTYIDKILLYLLPQKLSFKSTTIFIFLITFRYKQKTWCRDVLSRDSSYIFCVTPECTSFIDQLWLNKETQPFPLPTSPLYTTGMVSVLIVCLSLKTSGLFCISHQTTTSWSLLIIAFDSSRVINILLDTEWKCVLLSFFLRHLWHFISHVMLLFQFLSWAAASASFKGACFNTNISKCYCSLKVHVYVWY